MQIGLAQEGDVMDGCVVRQKKAYPVYDDDYAQHVETIRDEMEERYPNLHLVGRNGMHKYNNQDHAMMTAMLCVENILADTKLYDLWQVNGDAEYHEAGDAAAEETQRHGACAMCRRVVTASPTRAGCFQSETSGPESRFPNSSIGGQEQNKIPIAVNIVDARDRGPEFVFARPRRRIGGLLSRVGAIPFVRRRLAARCAARFSAHCFSRSAFPEAMASNFGMDRNHRVAKAIELALSLRFRSARSSSCPRPGTKPSARESRNPSGASRHLPLRRRRFSIAANRECIRARRGRACP